MTEHLFIRLTDDAETVFTIVVNGDGHLVRGVTSQTLESASRLTEGRQVSVLVPGEDVITTLADVPNASASRVRQMLPFSLEENFAADIDELQFAAGRRVESGKLAVSVVAKDKLDEWLQRIDAAGIQARSVHSETDGVPDTPATVNLMLEGDTTFGRCPGEAPFVLQDLHLPDLWELLELQHAEQGKLQHVMIYVDREALQGRQAEIEALRQRVASVDVKELADGCLSRFATCLVFQSGTNLLQGHYAPKSNVGALIRPWYAAAGLLLAVAAIGLVGEAAQYFKLRQDDQALAAELTQICATDFSSRLLSTCRAEMQRRLSLAGQSASANAESFLSTLAVVADATAGDIEIEALSYRNDVLDLELLLPSVARLDELDQQIASTARFELRMLTNTPEDSGIKSRIQVVASEL